MRHSADNLYILTNFTFFESDNILGFMIHATSNVSFAEDTTQQNNLTNQYSFMQSWILVLTSKNFLQIEKKIVLLLLIIHNNKNILDNKGRSTPLIQY